MGVVIIMWLRVWLQFKFPEFFIGIISAEFAYNVFDFSKRWIGYFFKKSKITPLSQ